MTECSPRAESADEYVLIPAYDWSDIRMLHWSKDWALLGGGRIGCTKCEATQPASSNFEPFVHQKVCPSWACRDQYPWAALRNIIQGLPTEKFTWPA